MKTLNENGIVEGWNNGIFTPNIPIFHRSINNITNVTRIA
jgi:hypothetical protein